MYIFMKHSMQHMNLVSYWPGIAFPPIDAVSVRLSTIPLFLHDPSAHPSLKMMVKVAYLVCCGYPRLNLTQRHVVESSLSIASERAQ